MVYINAISKFFPSKSIDNETLIKDYYGIGGKEKVTSADIIAQCKIHNRFESHPTDTAKNLGNAAANRLFEEWNIDRNEVEYLIFVSDALDYKGPTTACVMQHDLKLKSSVAAIDILHGCTGWVYGISLAKALIESKQVNNVLLITGDVPSKIIHPIDIELRSIFSDAAAATFISNKEVEHGMNASMASFSFGTDGSGEHDLKVERSATLQPADIEWLSQFKEVPSGLVGGRMVMNSSKVFLFALRKVPVLVNELLKVNKLKKEEIDFFILHQANGQMLDFLRKKMKIPSEKFVVNIESIGNTVSASIPIAIYDTFEAKKIKKGHQVLVAGFGIGLSWGGSILQF